MHQTTCKACDLILEAAARSGFIEALRRDVARSAPSYPSAEARRAVVLDWLSKEFALNLTPKIGTDRPLKPPRACVDCGAPVAGKRCPKCGARQPTRFFEELGLILDAEQEASTRNKTGS